jgi:cytochrome o ubiquinol oxidase subunit 2
MRFTFHGMSDSDFAQWVQQAKSNGSALSREAYVKLEAPSENAPVSYYASVAPGLYQDILTHCVHNDETCTRNMKPSSESGAMNARKDSDGMADMTASHP